MTPETLRGAVAAALASRPRTPVRRPGSVEEHPTPRIEMLTLNGFRVLRSRQPADPAVGEHVFEVKHFADGAETQVTVRIDPEAVARVSRLTHRTLQPGGAFWREQAERLLSAYLWSEGKAPEGGRLVVRDVSREDLELVNAWPGD